MRKWVVLDYIVPLFGVKPLAAYLSPEEITSCTSCARPAPSQFPPVLKQELVVLCREKVK
jgi:hypothetical protein